MTMHVGQEKVRFNLVRLKKGGNRYELVVDPNKAIEYREGKEVSLEDVLRSPNIFTDAHKGELAPLEDVKKDLGVESEEEAIEKILREGEIQLTEEYREKRKKQVYEQVVDIIHKNAIDARTKLPIPKERIKLAMEEAKARVDLWKDPKKQAEEIISKIKVILPIKLSIAKLQLVIPAQYAGKLYGEIKRKAEIKSENWNNDGSLTLIVEVPGGLKGEFIDEIEKLSHGGIEVKILGE